MGGEKTKTDPPVLRFDLCSQAFKDDPLPTLARMRHLGPVIRTRLALFGTVWLTTVMPRASEVPMKALVGMLAGLVAVTLGAGIVAPADAMPVLCQKKSGRRA